MRARQFALALFLSVAAVATSATVNAQLASGTITGTVTDQQGGVLPGVTVTLRGGDATPMFVTEADGKYRFLNLAPGIYTVTAALQGFTTLVRDNVTLDVGKNVDLPMQLRVASVSETITVTGASPIIDVRETGTATNFTSDELTRIPTSRDPFAIMRTVPGVMVDRVNVGGNETGQQSNFMSKGTRPVDATWTMDGVEITDMAATGGSPTYFNYDNFDEINVATSGQDIRSRTGGISMNLVVKRGTNQFHGMARGYFDNDSFEASNVPAESAALGVTPASADHTKQISDYGFELGGPIYRDKAWFYGSWSYQDVRLVRRAGNFIDETILKNPDVKLNWQATQKDMINFLYFNGDKIKDGRSPGIGGINIDAPTATYHQDNAYTSSPLHGLFKWEDNRVMASNLFLTGKYAYYNTGFILAPEGGLGVEAGRSLTLGQSFGSVNQQTFARPQHTINIDADSFLNGMGATHDLKVGFGWRRTDAASTNVYPGDMILAEDNSPADQRARLYRTAAGANRAWYLDFYAGDTIQKDRVTIDVGVRFDRQWGSALPSNTDPNVAFPSLVPGISFQGYKTPFTWVNVSPRAGLTYALDSSRKTVARASFSRFAGQLGTGNDVGFVNPSGTIGWVEYKWTDLNGDHLAQPNEVNTAAGPLAFGGGFNPANPTSVASANIFDPNFKAPVTSSFVAGVDRELMPNLALAVNYTYSRTSNWVNTYWKGVTAANYAAGPVLTGTLPDGSNYSVPTYIVNSAVVAANGNSLIYTNWNGYYTYYNGLEVSAVKRMSNKWMARAGFAYNLANEHYDPGTGDYVANGNPTRLDTESLVGGGIFSPRSSGSGSGDIFVNSKWTFNANGAYQFPWGLEAGASVFGRQGYPFPIYRSAALGVDSAVRVLVSPAVDSFRLPNLWDTDLRLAKSLALGKANLQILGDLFNLFNSNTALVRNRNVTSSSFEQLTQNLSPRIFRIGVRVGF
jgi:hypothetical protein